MEYHTITAGAGAGATHLQETQQDKHSNFDEEPEEDALSLCNLSLHDDESEQYSPSSSSSSSSSSSAAAEDDMDATEFSFDTDSECKTLPLHGVVFCGRSIAYRKPVDVDNSRGIVPAVPNPTRILDPFRMRSDSFKLSRGPPPSHFATRSSSVRLPANGSSSSRKHKVLIGLTKFPARMELSDIKKRQNRLPPAPAGSVVDGSQPVVAGGGKRFLGGLLRPLRFRSTVVGALARASFGCIPRA